MTGPIGSGALDLTPAEAKTVSSLLTRYLCGTEVWAFGSRTNGNATPASDLDLVAFTNTEQNALLASVREAFDASDLRFRVDLLAWKEVPESFRKEISRHHVVVMARRQASRPGWASRKLGDFASLKYGKTLRGPDRVEAGTVPVFGSNGQVGTHDEALTAGPTVIVGRKGTVGAVHYSPEPCWPIDTTYWHEDADAELCRFKYYLLGALRLDEMNSDSAVPGLSRGVAHALTVAVPPPAQQRAVARFLGALDDRIALGARIVRRLDGMARAIFKDWFVDFGPTRAKMEGRGADLAVDSSFLFAGALVESTVGRIPEGWSVTRFGDSFELIMGQSPPGRTYNTDGEGLPFLQGRADFGTRYAAPRRFCSAPARLSAPDDTLVSVRAPVGAVNIAKARCCIGRGVAAVRHRSGSAAYTYQAMCHLRATLESFESTGTVFGAVTRTQFESLLVVEPPAGVVEAFDRIVGPLHDRVRRSVQASEKLVELRDRLGERLVSGRLRLDSRGEGAAPDMGDAGRQGVVDGAPNGPTRGEAAC